MKRLKYKHSFLWSISVVINKYRQAMFNIAAAVPLLAQNAVWGSRYTAIGVLKLVRVPRSSTYLLFQHRSHACQLLGSVFSNQLFREHDRAPESSRVSSSQ